jgi:hypothetical protein
MLLISCNLGAAPPHGGSEPTLTDAASAMGGSNVKKMPYAGPGRNSQQRTFVFGAATNSFEREFPSAYLDRRRTARAKELQG